MLESTYQARLIKELHRRFPGCFILKNDPSYLQGIPDLVIFYGDRWAMLEVKASETAPTRPNQPYYVQLLDGMSYAAFIYPENQEQILSEIQLALTTGGHTRDSEREPELLGQLHRR